MRKHSLASILAVMVGLTGALCVVLVTPAAAQQEACVYLQPGAGYAAEMSVVFGGGVIGPSGTFPVGQTRCLPLRPVPDGAPYTVQVHAKLGRDIVCTPAGLVRHAAQEGNITYFATGTVFQPHCYMPSGPREIEPGFVHEE